MWGREMYTWGHTAKQKHGVGRVLTTKRVQACARARAASFERENVEMECGNEYEKGGAMYFTAVLERIISPPPKSRVSSMDVLHQNAITMQVWPIRTQLAPTAE